MLQLSYVAGGMQVRLPLAAFLQLRQLHALGGKRPGQASRQNKTAGKGQMQEAQEPRKNTSTNPAAAGSKPGTQPGSSDVFLPKTKQAGPACSRAVRLICRVL